MSGLTKRGINGAADALEVDRHLDGLKAQLAKALSRVATLEAKPDYVLRPISLGDLDPSVMGSIGGMVNAGVASAVATATTGAAVAASQDWNHVAICDVSLCDVGLSG